MLPAADVRAFCRDDVVFRFFVEFARAKHFEEAVLFVRAVVVYREAGPEQQRQAAPLVVATFLSPGAKREVNVDDTIAQPVREAVAAGRATSTVFDEAEAAVLAQLQQTYALFDQSDLHASMTAERDSLRARMFGADEMATMKEEEPVQLLVWHAASKVLAVLRNPVWWERDDAHATVVVSKVSLGDKTVGAAPTLVYERDVTTRVGPLTFRNVFATTQWAEQDAVVVHCRDVKSEGYSLVARFVCVPVSSDCCVVVEREFMRPDNARSSIVARLGAKKILKARRGHLLLLASKVSEQ